MTKVYNLASIRWHILETAMHISPVTPELLFKGRPGDPRLGEWVLPVSEVPPAADRRHRVVLLGNPDDQGVRGNLGRAGAQYGPPSIRRHLYKMTPPADWEWEKQLALFDLGDIIVAENIRRTHERTRSAVRHIAEHGATVVALGGGNDFTAPGFSGFCEGTQERGIQGPCGIINIDPHLDVRELSDGVPHSGSPYRQLVEEQTVRGRDIVEFGARRNRNARAHWEYCRENGMRVVPFEELRQPSGVATCFRHELGQLARRCVQIGVSIDIDSCQDGEGSSAAPVLGLSAWELYQCAAAAGANGKVGFFEVVEVAPSLDPTERTSRISAELVYAFLESRARFVTKAKTRHKR
jgi:formimidoylglutamase